MRGNPAGSYIQTKIILQILVPLTLGQMKGKEAGQGKLAQVEGRV